MLKKTQGIALPHTTNFSSGSSLEVKRIRALYVPFKMVQELCLEVDCPSVFGLIFYIKPERELVVMSCQSPMTTSSRSGLTLKLYPLSGGTKLQHFRHI